MVIIGIAVLVGLTVAVCATAPTISYAPYSTMIEPAELPEMFRLQAVQLRAGTYLAGTVVGKSTTLTNINDVQTLTITGIPTGGVFQLSFNGQVTTALPWNATALQVQNALLALSTITRYSGDTQGVTVGLVGAAYTVTFQNQCGNQWQPPIVLYSNSLTGGANPSVTSVHTTPGNSANGQWGPYLSTNTDGTQFAKGIIQMQTIVDTFGNHVAGGGEWNQGAGFGEKSAPAVTQGRIFTADCVPASAGAGGLDANACTAVGQLGRIADGSVSNLLDPGTILAIGL